MSGSYNGIKQMIGKVKAEPECPHNVIRRKRGAYTFNAYVCGSCAKLFEVEDHVEPPPYRPEPMGSESKVPWGLRGRQA